MILLSISLLLVAFHMILRYQKGKKHSFYPKMASTRAIYDVISKYHSNQLSPNVTKMCLKDIRTVTEAGMSLFVIFTEFLPATWG